MNLNNYETNVEIGNSENKNHKDKPINAGKDLSQFPPGRKRLPALPENLLRLFALGLALLCLAAMHLHACGPDFPNNLLDRGDEAVLAAPVADFERELQRLKLAPSRFNAVLATNSYEAATMDAELADLARALQRADVAVEEAARIQSAHQANRDKLRKYQTAFAAWNDAIAKSPTPPACPVLDEVAGLPGEFADYLAGAISFHDPATSALARAAWEKLLARPASERKYKSTWAAFMLGKLWENEDDDKAVEYFQMTRELAKQRFADALGLATAATGREARVELRRKHFGRAMKLYLEQYASGDMSAVASLRWTAQQALADGVEELASLAALPDTQSVITAHLISGERERDFADGDYTRADSVTAWLQAVEAANVTDVDSAERLALAAYQAGNFEIAQRWVKRAANTPVARWLQAKLWLHAGKLEAAANLLAAVVRSLPPEDAAEAADTATFADSLHVDETRPVRAQILGELGVLQLTRRDFTLALDALLRAGCWMDAAYVAERVLTTDELKDYVDRAWPAAEAEAMTGNNAPAEVASTSPAAFREQIRYLLARRLTREDRNDQSAEYYPAQWRSKYQELIISLQAGWNEALTANDRARWLFNAAGIARTNGMELLGTEVEPDWQVHGGNYTYGVTGADRAANTADARINVASAEEITRATRHHADPEVRFHYRYQAAFLGWEAAKLMPDNSDDTARVLYTSGSWLKERDPETADLFYKALVRRCRKTELGDEADRRRWFPPLDATGKIMRLEEEVIEPETEPIPEIETTDPEAADPDVENILELVNELVPAESHAEDR